MKKTFFSFIGMIMAYLLCSCDKEYLPGKFRMPVISGVELSQDCIQLVFSATEDKYSLKFLIQTHEEGNIWIDWGEENKLYSYCNGEIFYQFPAVEKEYYVTIQTSKISSIQFMEEGGGQLRSLVFGDCLSLEEFSLPEKANQIKKLDLTRCPLLKDEFIFHIYDPEFDFNGLKNFRRVYYYLHCTLPVVLDGYQSSHIHIYPEVDSIPEITIQNTSNLQNVYIQNRREAEGKEILYVNKLELDASNAQSIGIYDIAVGHPLDLNSLSFLKYLWLQNFDCPDTIHFPSSLKGIAFNNEEMEYDNRLTYLDFTICKDLETLYLYEVKSLNKLDIHGLYKLKQVIIFNSGLTGDQEY